MVLRNVSIDVPSGEVVALLGPNGAGKTTVLRAASGLIRSSSGSVVLGGVDVSKREPHDRLRSGLCLIPEGRGIFRSLTVAENLRLYLPPWAKRGASYDTAVDLFPVLAERLKQAAGSMSGGQQQMLALARAYLSGAVVVMLDEVSMGLSPIMVDEVFAAIRQLAATGVALVVVEQYVNRALGLADSVVVMRKGEVVHVGSPSQLDEAALAAQYLGADLPAPA
ncbi:ABC transporter ATP-binding protein [Acidiferrimicrobium sp. IK]|uniref:ABC transporter ATP-binding protein n=1 Tax=Acidiferrimicrobium sp. IK TaxID=2871700 RepID=UPI0021CB8B2A|nr:ABC transporter ATP-binding protein [Acidiferrimicrobium sp. IK]MCU4186634.1 ABC transporter ATP-binding protein [Acidiferrimicrobium sp. IK]